MVDKNRHHFDMMNWWLGAKPKRVAAFGGLAVTSVVEPDLQVNDYSSVNVDYDNGAGGTTGMHVCRDFPNEDLEMGIVGESVLQTRISGIEILQWKRGKDEGSRLRTRWMPRPGWVGGASRIFRNPRSVSGCRPRRQAAPDFRGGMCSRNSGCDCCGQSVASGGIVEL